MNTCLLVLKFVQFFISALIGILFTATQDLVANPEAIVDGKSGPERAARISIKSLVCKKPPYDFDVPDRNFTNVKVVVKFEERGRATDRVDLDEIRMTLGCLKYYDGNKSECTCWNSFYVLGIIVVAAFTAVTTMCDIVTILTADSYHDAHVTCVQGFTSCICSVVTAVMWVAIGIVVIFYIHRPWPLVYLEGSNDPDEVEAPSGATEKQFYLIPDSWHLATILCFSFAGILVLEGVVFLGLSDKLHLKLVDLFISPEKNVEEEGDKPTPPIKRTKATVSRKRKTKSSKQKSVKPAKSPESSAKNTTTAIVSDLSVQSKSTEASKIKSIKSVQSLSAKSSKK